MLGHPFDLHRLITKILHLTSSYQSHHGGSLHRVFFPGRFSMAVADFITEQAEIQLIRAADWTKTLSELVDEKRRTISSPELVMMHW